MRLAKILEDQLGVSVLASNRRPFPIDVYSATSSPDGITVAIRATNPYSGAAWWWVFTTGAGPDLSIVSVVTDGAYNGQAATHTEHVPGNVLDIAVSIIEDLWYKSTGSRRAAQSFQLRQAEVAAPISKNPVESDRPPSPRS